MKGNMKQFYEATEKRVKQVNLRMLAIVILIFIFAFLGIFGSYTAVLNNANSLGKNLVESYASDEEKNISMYTTIIELGMIQINDMVNANISEDRMRNVIKTFFKQAKSSTKDEDLLCYVILNGKLIASDDVEGIESYDYKKQEWYKRAINVNGEVIFTNSYLTEKDRSNVVTISAANKETGNAVIIDLTDENLDTNHADIDLPERSAFYVFNQYGETVYTKTPFSADKDTINKYSENLYLKMKDGDHKINDNIIDFEGEKRAFYYTRLENGWTVVLTVPRAVLTAEINWMVLMYVALFAALMIVVLIMWLRESRVAKQTLRATDTIRALCNSFYAIYRIDTQRRTFEMIKGTDDIKLILSRSGSYDNFLTAACSFMDTDTAEEMRCAFSFEKIKENIEKRTENYGGSFVRVKDGEKKWMSVNLFLDDDVSSKKAVIAFHVIDEEKKRQLQHIKLLEGALKEAENSKRSQEQFFASMSHELRTPINIILGMNELAADPACPEEKRLDYYKKTETTGRRMLELVNNILEVSRLESGQSPLEKKHFDLESEVRSMMQPMAERAKNEEKKFVLDIAVENSKVIGDPLKLSQILINLVGNSLKYTNRDDTVTITVRQAGENNSNYIFTVQDTGIGISEKFLPKLFDPYSQGSQFGTGRHNGTGLGLAIVKSLVTQKNGTISVESKVGVGTKFTVTLPLMPDKDNAKENKPQKTVGKDILKGMNILLVDDNELNREIMYDMLTACGSCVTQACDGKEAVDKFAQSQENDIDLILMDMNMPVMNGCEATKAIRQLFRADAGKVLIIALTANAFAEDVSETVKAGMNAHLAKPANIDLLCRTLARLREEKR